MATLTKQTVSKQKTSRLDIRLTDAQRQLIERAAELTGSTLTQWTTRHLLESARKDIEEATVLHLESQAFEDFIQALDQPVPPAAEKLMEMDPQWACYIISNVRASSARKREWGSSLVEYRSSTSGPHNAHRHRPSMGRPSRTCHSLRQVNRRDSTR